MPATGLDADHAAVFGVRPVAPIPQTSRRKGGSADVEALLPGTLECAAARGRRRSPTAGSPHLVDRSLKVLQAAAERIELT